jgi:hypothetical protein
MHTVCGLSKGLGRAAVANLIKSRVHTCRAIHMYIYIYIYIYIYELYLHVHELYLHVHELYLHVHARHVVSPFRFYVSAGPGG